MEPPMSSSSQIWKEVGEVTIVFNNAGVRLVRPFVQYTQAQIEKMISVNLMGQVRCVYLCVRVSVYGGHELTMIN